MQFVIYLFICSFGQIFSPQLLIHLVSVPMEQAGFCISGRNLLDPNWASARSAWITGSQLVFYSIRLKCFSPLDCLLLERRVSARIGRFFHIFYCGCYYSALQQQTPCSFLERCLKCYFWHLYFLQRVNAIAVIGLASALSQLTAPPLLAGGGGDVTRELYLESQEQRQGDRQPSNKPYFFHSSWAKVQLHANTKKAEELEGFN